MKNKDMEYRPLTGTNMNVSAVSLGSIGFMRGDRTPKEIAQITHYALDHGINFIDTAYGYQNGGVEKALGSVLSERRDECYLLTRSHLRDPEEFERSVEGSFERLQTDTIDILQLHDVSSEEEYEKLLNNGIYDSLTEKVEQGRIRYAGISTHGPLSLMKRMVTSNLFSVITLAYNVTGSKRQPEDGEFLEETGETIFPLTREHNVGLTVMKPFGGGAILRKAPDGTHLNPVKCLLYSLHNQYVSTVSPGVNNLEQLKENLQAGKPGLSLSQKEMDELKQAAEKWGQFFCRQCGYCLPCTVDIHIPKVMRALEDWKAADSEQAQKESKDAYSELEVLASDCVECEECEEKCPYDLPIINRMKEAVEAFK